VSAVRLI